MNISFLKNKKNSILGYFGHSVPKSDQTEIFSKNQIRQFFDIIIT